MGEGVVPLAVLMERAKCLDAGRLSAANVAAGALVAATVGAGLDVARGFSAARGFVTEGFWKFGLLVWCLYGAWTVLAGLGLRGLFGVLWERTAAGRLAQGEAVGRGRLLFFGVALPGGLVGAAMWGTTLWLTVRFHHRGLAALLGGGLAAGLGLCAGAVSLLAEAVVPVKSGRRTWTLRGPLSAWTGGLAVGVAGFGLGMAGFLWGQGGQGLGARGLALRVALGALLGWALAMGFGAGVGRLLGAVLSRGGWQKDGRGGPVLWPVGVLLACGTGVWLWHREWFAQVDLRAVQTGLVLGVGTVAGVVYLPRFGKGKWDGWVWLLPVLLWLGAGTLGESERLRKGLGAGVPLASQGVGAVARLLDFDGDGAASKWAIGGRDCNDGDGDVYPGAFDWPDDGVDQNCNGHDAHAKPTRAVEVPLPAFIPTKPNIVLITIDALRADHVSSYGYSRKTTAALDALADGADGVLFEQAFAHAPSTRYSVPAILTGRYPSQIAWGPPWAHWPPQVLPENKLLSELLQTAGYETMALLSYHYFEPTWGLARGFADYDYHLQTLHSLGGDPAATSGSSAKELTDLAISKLARRVQPGDGAPFFLWMHYYDPHFRYEWHAPPEGEPAFGNREVDLYDGEIRYTDEHIGRLLRFLAQSSGWDKTVVVVTADHGEGLGEHGLPPDRRHGYHLYANQTKVPLMMRLPGLSRAGGAKRVSQPAGHIDILPSVLALAGVAVPKQAAGESLWPLVFSGGGAKPRRVFQEVMYEGPTVRKALFDGRYHFIENVIPDGTRELYDLAKDPGEEHDLQGLAEDVQTRLSRELSVWLDDSAVPPGFAEHLAGRLSQTPIPVGVGKEGRFGNCLRLVGVERTGARVRRGETLSVEAVLKAEKRVPAGYKLFVHMRGTNGGFVNADHDLLGGLLPLQRLRPGMYVKDETKVLIPAGFPVGRAQIVMGLYRKQERMPVEGDAQTALVGDKSLLLLDVTVE